MSAGAKRSKLDKVHVTNTPLSFSEAIYPSRSYRYYTQECPRTNEKLPQIKLEKDIASHHNNALEQMAESINRFVQPLPIASIDSDSICKPRLIVNTAHKQVMKRTYPPSIDSYFGCYLTNDVYQHCFSQRKCGKGESSFLQSELLNYNTFFPELSLKNAWSNEKRSRLLSQQLSEIINRSCVLNYLSMPKELQTTMENIAEFSVRSTIKPFTSAKVRQFLRKQRIKQVKRPRPLQPTRRGAKVTFEHKIRGNNQSKFVDSTFIKDSVYKNKHNHISKTESTKNCRKNVKEVGCLDVENVIPTNEIKKKAKKEITPWENEFDVKDTLFELVDAEVRRNHTLATPSEIASISKTVQVYSTNNNRSTDVSDADDKCDDKSEGSRVRYNDEHKNSGDSSNSEGDDDDDDGIFSDNSDDVLTESDNSGDKTD